MRGEEEEEEPAMTRNVVIILFDMIDVLESVHILR